MKYITFVFRILLGLFFILAGLGKLLDAQIFQKTLSEFHLILPNVIVPYFVIILPLIEVTLGLFLIFGFFTKLVSISISSLLIIFIILLKKYGIQENCGCLGIFNFLNIFGDKTFLRNYSFLIISIMIFFQKNQILSVDNILLKSSIRSTLSHEK